MCGIAGFADTEGIGSESDGGAAVLVHDMCEVIRHRGPDDEGIHVEPGVGLGMRRLSIIDLSTGNQPIHNEDRTIWVVFNGEIYNYRELRTELEQAGHCFYTSSDTETIVHAYEAWGEEAFERLRGMFGIALWDRSRRALFVARDRAGIKPIYYAEAGGRLFFGSEIKSLLAAGVDRTLDLGALDHYLTFLYTPRDGSIFRGIRKLPPGHILRWQGGRATVRPYWQLPVEESFSGTEAEAADGLHDVLRDAVRSHLVSDVPLGAFLSGGIDSSLVVGLMSEVSDRPVKTFSIGFEEPQFDELEHARTRRDALPHRPPRVRGPAGRVVDPRSADRALRRAVRGFFGHPDLVRLRDGAPPRDRRALGRWRRRAVRRLRPLPAAPARRRVRSAADPWRAQRRGRLLAASSHTARGARTSSATWPVTIVAASSMRRRSFSRTRRPRCTRRTS